MTKGARFDGAIAGFAVCEESKIVRMTTAVPREGWFATVREGLIKIGARDRASRAHPLPTSSPEAALFRAVALRLAPSSG